MTSRSESLQQAWSTFESGDLKSAAELWRRLVESAAGDEERDSANWGLGYVLVEQGHLTEAAEIWQEIFDRTGNHRALHQVGMVEREGGRFTRALETFRQEQRLIAKSTDMLARAVNLYEITFVALLLDEQALAEQTLAEYSNLPGLGADQCERACHARLCGDVASISDPSAARVFYASAREAFLSLDDPKSADEIDDRIARLDAVHNSI